TPSGYESCGLPFPGWRPAKLTLGWNMKPFQGGATGARKFLTGHCWIAAIFISKFPVRRRKIEMQFYDFYLSSIVLYSKIAVRGTNEGAQYRGAVSGAQYLVRSIGA
ncbi:MAG: hypothetical protein WAW37_20910, partial [Syntrophobacteraceae bacterium]